MMQIPNRYSTAFVIVETPGRQQPYAIWRLGQVHRFEATRAKAEAYVRMERNGWRDRSRAL